MTAQPDKLYLQEDSDPDFDDERVDYDNGPEEVDDEVEDSPEPEESLDFELDDEE